MCWTTRAEDWWAACSTTSQPKTAPARLSRRPRLLGSAADRTLRGRAHQLRVLREHAAPVAGRRWRPLCPALLELVRVDEQVEGRRREVEPNPVPVTHEGDRTAVERLGCDM